MLMAFLMYGVGILNVIVQIVVHLFVPQMFADTVTIFGMVVVEEFAKVHYGYAFGIFEFFMRPQWSWVSLAPLLMHCITVYVGNFYWAIGIHFAWNMFAFLVLEGLYTGSLKDAVKLRLERKEKVKVTKYKSYNYDQHKNLFTMQAGKGQVYGLTLYDKYVYHVPVTCSARDFTKLS